MLQCNITKSGQCTVFILNVDSVFVRNRVLWYINEKKKRSAESMFMLYIDFCPSSFDTCGAS